MITQRILVLSVAFTATLGYGPSAFSANDGVFKVKRADPSNQPKYANLLDSFESPQTWAALGSAREGGVAQSYQAYSKLMNIYVPLIIENGETPVPVYVEDSLNLKDIEGFRKFAQSVEYDKNFVATNETCSAAKTFTFPTQIAGMLTDLRPEYVYGETRTESSIANTREERISKEVNDLHYASNLCANYADHNYQNGYINLYMNLQGDLKNKIESLAKKSSSSSNTIAGSAPSQTQTNSLARPFDLPTASKFIECSGFFGALSQSIKSLGGTQFKSYDDVAYEFNNAAIVFSNVNYMLDNSQIWKNEYLRRIKADPAGVQTWGEDLRVSCLSIARQNRPIIEKYSQDAQSEFSSKLNGLLNNR
ncbi:hypothetical protein LLW09_07395 [Pseudomonas paracarnis]|uniref:DUF3829 domain-containing protein n=1 Tax=Pseudomonas paracarnis TaxID=2750625 RepID=A0ABU6BQS8_9PSED|nr:hypothetical protein [Pseudomonas paracarnis]MEB3782378.1 hypothetical protein [Pseudomonas paracarnis]